MSEKPSDKSKKAAEVDPFALPNQVIAFTPTSPKVERLITLLNGDRNIGIHRVKTPEEMIQITRQQAPCLLLVSAATKEDILKATTALGAMRDLASKHMIKGIAISKIDDKRLQKAFNFLGCSEFILDSVPDHTVYFKIGLQLKALRMKRVQTEKEVARKKKKDGQATADAEKKGGATTVTYKEALDLPHDIWLMAGAKPRKVGLNWIFDFEGPDPNSGDWRTVGGAGNPRWFWKSRDESGNETKANSDATGWSFLGNRPIFDVKTGKWKLVSKEPQLFFKFNGKTQASKIETKNNQIIIAADSVQAPNNIEFSKAIGVKAKAIRQSDPTGDSDNPDKRRIPESVQSSDGSDEEISEQEAWGEPSKTSDSVTFEDSTDVEQESELSDDTSSADVSALSEEDSGSVSETRGLEEHELEQELVRQKAMDADTEASGESPLENTTFTPQGSEELSDFDRESQDSNTKKKRSKTGEGAAAGPLTEEEEREELAALQKRYYEGLPLSATEKKRLAMLKRKFSKVGDDSSGLGGGSTNTKRISGDSAGGSGDSSGSLGEFSGNPGEWSPEESEFNNHLRPEDRKPGSQTADYTIEQEAAGQINNRLTPEEELPPYAAQQALAKKRRKDAKAHDPSGKQYAEIETKTFDAELGAWYHVEGFGFVYITPAIASLKVNQLRSHENFWILRNSSTEGPIYKPSHESWLFDRAAPLPENIPGFALLDHRVQKYLEIMTGELLSEKDASGRIRLELANQEARTYELEQAGEILEATPELAPEAAEAKAKSRKKIQMRLEERRQRRAALSEEQKQTSIAIQSETPPPSSVHVGYLPFQLSLSERIMKKDTPEQLFPWICEEMARYCNATRVAILRYKSGEVKEMDVLGSSFEKEVNRADTSFLLAFMPCIEQSFQTGMKTFDSGSNGTSIVYPVKREDEVLALIWLELSAARGPFTDQDEQFVVEAVLSVLWKFFTVQQAMAQAA